MKSGLAWEEDEKYTSGTGWTFLHNDYVYPRENPSSADFGIRHSAFHSVHDGT